jgi:LPXTG-site transpeptidase (sortase) family protein
MNDDIETSEIPVVEDTRRSHRREKPKKMQWSDLSVGGKILAILSDLLFTAAFIVALYILYQLYWTAVPAYYEQQELSDSIKWDEPDSYDVPAVPLDYLPCDSTNDAQWEKLWGDNWKSDYDLNWKTPSEEKTMIGRVYSPALGTDFLRNLVEGTSRSAVLDHQGFGHYSQNAMPGCVGNFASAAHRDGYGAPLGDVENFKIGDAIVIRTQHYWYVYKTTGHEIVSPEQNSVLLPVPNQASTRPTDRLLTFTTCHPRMSIEKRYIEYGKFSYWAEVKSGVPQELLDAGVKVVR